MTRLLQAWRSMRPEQRLAAAAAIALLLTMFFPWYGLQSLNRKSGVIYSHNISAFGDVSFVEAAIFLVAVAIIAMLFARVEGRRFHMPGGDGTVVAAAGAWAGLLIFYRVFSRPAGDGYPVGIEWGFFLAFVAAGSLAFAGLRMRADERPAPPLVRSRRTSRRTPVDPEPGPGSDFGSSSGSGSGSGSDEAITTVTATDPGEEIRVNDTTVALPPRRLSTAPVPADARRKNSRAPYPPAPPRRPADAEQLSFEDPPTRPQ